MSDSNGTGTKDSDSKAHQNGDLAKNLNGLRNGAGGWDWKGKLEEQGNDLARRVKTLRTVPGTPNPFVESETEKVANQGQN
jgi:hypothetical protein